MRTTTWFIKIIVELFVSPRSAEAALHYKSYSVNFVIAQYPLSMSLKLSLIRHKTMVSKVIHQIKQNAISGSICYAQSN